MQDKLIGGGNHVSSSSNNIVLTAIVNGKLSAGIVPAERAIAAGLILRDLVYSKEGIFLPTDGGDWYEGTPSPSEVREILAKRELLETTKWLPLPKGGRFDSGDLVPSIPASVVAELLGGCHEN